MASVGHVKLRFDVISHSHVLKPSKIRISCEHVLMLKKLYPFCFNFPLLCHVANPTLMKTKLSDDVYFKHLHHKMFLKPSRDAFCSLVFFLPPIFSSLSVKTTSDGAGSVLRSTWLLFHRTSSSYTQSTSNVSPVQASKSGAVCFCHSCPSPCLQTWCLCWAFISKHMLDVIIPRGLIFASFWWGPAASLWRICARSDVQKQSREMNLGFDRKLALIRAS